LVGEDAPCRDKGSYSARSAENYVGQGPGKKPTNTDRNLAVVVTISLALAIILVSVSVSRPSGNSSEVVPVTGASACNTPDPQVADPDGPHGLFVLDPPVRPSQAYFAATNEYLLNNSAVCGADFQIHWNEIDAGPNASPRYNWSSITQDIAPWAAAGKKVNLIFQTSGYGPNQSYIPSYVLPEIRTIQCGESPVTPLYWLPSYVGLYEDYMRAVVEHFQGDSEIGYLRFGLGGGGETFPLFGLQSDPSCDRVLNATGFTMANWTSYLDSMLVFEHSLGSSVPLMVALDHIMPGVANNVSENVAATAASLGIGIGGEGLTASQAYYNSSGEPVCHSGSCRVFEQYAGEIPLEFQTQTASQPNGSGSTGSLAVMLPWAVGVHTQIFELYLVDWLTAFDPHYSAYGEYHVTYTSAINAAAAVVDHGVPGRVVGPRWVTGTVAEVTADQSASIDLAQRTYTT
jgi:hypothetical protein